MKSFYFTAFLLLSTTLVSAQKKERFEGEYQWNQLRGRAEFDYILVENDSMVLDGDFIFTTQSDPESRFFEKNEVNGIYQKNLKTGRWSYSNDDFQILIRDVTNLKLDADLVGTRINLSASYKYGIPDGKWSYEEISLNGEQQEVRTSTDELLFKDGELSEKLEIRFIDQNQSQFIRGKLLENGVMDGEWTFVYSENNQLVNEVRNYKNGFLLSIIKRELRSDKLLDEVIFYETIDQLKALDTGTSTRFRIADKTFGLVHSNGFLSSSANYKAQQGGNSFLRDFFEKLLKYEAGYWTDKDKLIKYPIHTRSMVYEFSRNQQRSIEILPSFFEEVKNKANKYLKDDSFELNQYSSDSMARSFAIHRVIDAHLASMEELFQLLRTKDIQYHDVNFLYSTHPELFPTEIPFTYSFGDNKKSEVLKFQVSEFDSDFFKGLETYLSQIGEILKREQKVVDESLFVIRQDSELLDLDKQITLKSEATQALYLAEVDNSITKTVFNQVSDGYLNWLKNQFSQETVFTRKKEIGQMILQQLADLITLYPELLDLSLLPDQVDEAYQEEVFNPFTYSRYSQRVKPRLYESYEDLIGHYTARILESDNSQEVKKWIQKIKKASARLIELKDQDTKKLERSLKRRSQISRIESLLGL